MSLSNPLLLLTLATILVIPPNRALAHNLGIDFKIINDQVAIESYYDDDTPCSNAKIHVERGDKSILTSGRTDKDGRWSFPKPPTGKYTIVVNDGAGHVARSKLTVGAPPSESPSPIETVQPTRQEFTRVPWRNLALGLAIIAGGTLGLKWLLKRRVE